MKALFFIEIPSQFPTEKLSYYWYKKELENELYGCNTLDEIKNLSLACDVILIFPGFNITHKQITSKIRNRKKLELAIAYQLEEILSDDIESLFFAYQAAKEKHSFDVAVVNKAWFEKWLDFFNQHEILLSAAISDTLLLENMPQDYLLIQKSDYYLLKTPTLSYAIDNENINHFLNSLKELLPEELLLIISNSENKTLLDSAVNLKSVPIQDCLLKLLTDNYTLATGFNLLQGSYQPKLKNDWQTIKWVTIGLFGLFFIATSFQAYQHWQLTQQESKLEAQREKIFRDSFPAMKRIVNPLMQMKNELEKLKQAQQQQGQFISLLAKVSVGLRQLIAQDKIHLLGMELGENILTIKLNAASLALIEETKQNLTQQQLNVEMESPEKVDNQVNATFKIAGNTE